MRIELNNSWIFSKYKDFSQSENVRLPHSNCILPYNYTNEQDYQYVSYYKHNLKIEPKWIDKKLFLHFDGVAHVCKVLINGHIVARHNCGYTAFIVDITRSVNIGDNELIVEVDSRESLNVPPFGNVIDYLTYGGIYRNVYLEVKEKIFIEDIFVKGYAESNPYNLSIDISLNKSNVKLKIICKVVQDSEEIFAVEEIVNNKLTNIFGIADAKLWTIDQPNLAHLIVELYDRDKLIDSKEIDFGFRTCRFEPDGFYLNGEKVKIMGLNRHQSYPYVGYAMPSRPQRRDARILKYELGVNAVRTSHYPQSHDFIDECDKIGLLVFTEIPGWQYIGDKKWQSQAVINTIEMVKQYRNHPSIILWGVRINESQDCDELYSQTNKIARELDDTRQTGGVRYIANSNLLEDVYTYNDFVHTGNNEGTTSRNKITKNKVPYLITEYNGHMFPTKIFDDEAHRTEHAIRHANVINSYMADNTSAGGFGWCMFDYNTHKDFGSGDKICYHGVMDVFRNGKIASAIYASQSDIRNVLEITSTIDRGEYPKSNIGDIYAITNADSVKVYRNDKFIKEFFPNKGKYNALKHPPILIDDLLGNTICEEQGFSELTSSQIKEIIAYGKEHGVSHVPLKYAVKIALICAREKISLDKLMPIMIGYAGGWGAENVTYRFDAIKNDVIVKTVCRKPITSINLDVDVDTKKLIDNVTYDVASVRIRALDFYGNVVPYYMESVELKCSGCVELIGPNIITLKGGCGGTFVRTTGEKGNGNLTISGIGGDKTIKFVVE